MQETYLKKDVDILALCTGLARNNSLTHFTLLSYKKPQFDLQRVVEMLEQNYSITGGTFDVDNDGKLGAQFALICERNKILKVQKRFKTLKRAADEEPPHKIAKVAN